MYGRRHAANNPAFNSPDSRSKDGLPNPEGSTAEEEGFGRKSARVTGMMEGDRPMQVRKWIFWLKYSFYLPEPPPFYFCKSLVNSNELFVQGIFPAKKMTKAMAPILPETELSRELPPEKKK